MIFTGKELPIIFSGQMVRAILDDRKTQTRRIVKPQPLEGDWHYDEIHCALLRHDAEGIIRCPYGGDGNRLWVRETCRTKELTDEEAENYDGPGAEDWESPPYGLDGVLYLADNHFHPIENTRAASEQWMELNAYRSTKGATVAAIHMPRWASRITLEIVSVRVERLQYISKTDARAEGLSFVGDGAAPYGIPGNPDSWHDDPRMSFRALWDSIYAKRAPWSSNPYVWVTEFKRVIG